MAPIVAERWFASNLAAVFGGLCLWLICAALQAASADEGAGYSHEIRRWIDEAGRDPAKAVTTVTVIVETDSATISSLISAHGGKLRYRWGRLHEVAIPAGRPARCADRFFAERHSCASFLSTSTLGRDQPGSDAEG